jgi:phosphatidylinositol dimannoside acyltransferase
MKARLVGAAYSLGWSVVCRLPESWVAAMFRFFADIAWRRQGHSVQVLEGNLLRVLGPDVTGKQLRAASRESMRSYLRYWLEIFRLPVMPTERIVGDMDETGNVAEMLENLERGRGVIVPLPHMGNWDQAGAWVIGRGAGGFTTVMERLQPESLYERFVGFREGLGFEVLPASGGPHPFGVLAQRLRKGKLVTLLVDRDVTGSGIEVDFFGEKALMMGGSAALAVQTGAALMPATLWFEDGGWGVHIHPEIPVPAAGDRRQKAAQMTQEIARIFEQGIKEHPADWHMLQKVFVRDLDPDRLAAAKARNGQARIAASEPRAAVDEPQASAEPTQEPPAEPRETGADAELRASGPGGAGGP